MSRRSVSEFIAWSCGFRDFSWCKWHASDHGMLLTQVEPEIPLFILVVDQLFYYAVSKQMMYSRTAGGCASCFFRCFRFVEDQDKAILYKFQSMCCLIFVLFTFFVNNGTAIIWGCWQLNSFCPPQANDSQFPNPWFRFLSISQNCCSFLLSQQWTSNQHILLIHVFFWQVLPQVDSRLFWFRG